MDELLLFTAVGFAAQLVDGALGMVYGAPGAIGSVEAAGYFVTGAAISILTIGLERWPIIAGLIVGGACAAPFAVRNAAPSDRPLMILVAVLASLLSARNLLQVLT